MIPRLWSCTSHPTLEWLALPFSPVVICLLVLVAAFLPVSSPWSLRVRRLWHSLLTAALVSTVAFALAGHIAQWLGGRGNSSYVAARYAFPALAWAAVAWSNLDVARLELQGTKGTRPVRLVRWSRSINALSALLAVFLLVLTITRWFIPGVQRPWSLPYEIAEWYFDDATMSFASDECLAFRATDDVAKFGTSDPGHAARVALRRSEHRAVPGVAAFLADRLTVRELCYGAPCGVTTGLLAFLAETGDHPLLAEYEAYPVLQMREIRECLHSGRQVKWAGPLGWKCLEPEQLPRTGVE